MSDRDKDAGILVLRHQIMVLERAAGQGPAPVLSSRPPTAAWVARAARNLVMDLEDAGSRAINRFAGADLSVMTDFEALFGRGSQLALTTTFRCPQTVCDVAWVFVSANPGQYSKPMRSTRLDPGPPITVIQAADPADALARYLGDLSDAVAAGRVPAVAGLRPARLAVASRCK